MKKTLLIAAALFFVITTHGQTMRCYEIGYHDISTGVWQDTSFVACTYDGATIALADAQLALPAAMRDKHFNGALLAGNDGHNRNGDFFFSWHINPDDWTLTDISMELCDGKPYTDVESDTLYWLNNVGRFCPWQSYVRREVSNTSIRDNSRQPIAAVLIENPVNGVAAIGFSAAFKGDARLTDASGRVVLAQRINVQAGTLVKLQTEGFVSGLYFVKFDGNVPVSPLKLVKQ